MWLVVAHLRLQGRDLAAGDVGRIAEDGGEAGAASQRRQQVGAEKANPVSHPVALGVAAGHGEGVPRHIRRQDAGGCTLTGNRHGDGSTTAAHVEDLPRRPVP